MVANGQSVQQQPKTDSDVIKSEILKDSVGLISDKC